MIKEKHILLKFIITIFMTIMMVSCFKPSGKATSKNKNLNPSVDVAKNLTRKQAQERFSQVKDVNYLIDFDLTSESELRGKVVITFERSEKALNKPLRIDFQGQSVVALTINSKEIKNIDYNKVFISIPFEYLLEGKNSLSIQYIANYQTDGTGLHRFKDPLDNKTYLYTQLEPYDANKVFPCFDQPDLKASYKIKVKAPTDWQIISNTREVAIEKNQQYNLWTFKKTKRFSTYIFALIAGDFQVWERSSRYPLRLFARKSLAKYVPVKRWFDYTEYGFNFFEKFFQIPYPYEKYDQIVAPQFNAGAMENVAAVTFSEFLVPQSNHYDIKLELTLAEVIFHEMAHMWFGNLVTMKWWDDLWLNESFATFMAFLAASEHTKFKQKSWFAFFNKKKNTYLLDQKEITHSIASEIISTDEAFANFDSITYYKGAAWLKLIYSLMGKESFSKALFRYFDQYKEKNTTLNDFVSSLLENFPSSVVNKKSWVRPWLEKSGVNVFSAKTVCKNNSIETLVVEQDKANSSKALRANTFDYQFYKQKNEKLEKIYESTILIDAKDKTILSWKLAPPECPDLVLLNTKDNSYMLQKFDDQQKEVLLKNFNDIDNDLLRNLLWFQMSKMMMEKKITSYQYLDMVVKNLTIESHNKDNLYAVLDSLIKTDDASSAIKLNFYKNNNFDEDTLKAIKQIKIWLINTIKDKSQKKFTLEDYLKLVEYYSYFANSTDDILTLKSLLSSSLLDQPNRWRLILALSAVDSSDAVVKIINQEYKKDSSEEGHLRYLMALSRRPNIQNKLKYLDFVKNNPDKVNEKTLIYMNYSMFPYFQNKMKIELFEKVKTLVLDKDLARKLRSTSVYNLPSCHQKTKEFLKTFVRDQSLHPSLLKSARSYLESTEKCLSLIR